MIHQAGPSVSCKPPMDRAAQTRQLLRVPFHFPARSEAIQRAEINDLPSIIQAAKGNSKTSPEVPGLLALQGSLSLQNVAEQAWAGGRTVPGLLDKGQSSPAASSSLCS